MTTPSRGSLRRLRPLAAGALFLALLAGQLGPVRAADTQEELDQARRAVERLQDDLEIARDRLNRIEAEVQSLTNQISQYTAQKEALGAAIEQTRAAIRRSERKAEALQVDLNERARDVYIAGPAGALELVLEASSLRELSDRFSFLEVLSRNDTDVAAGLEVQRDQQAELRANLRGYELEVERLLGQLEGKSELLQAKFAQQQAAAADVQDKLKEARALVEDLEKKLQRELLQQYGFVGGGTAGPPPAADGPFYWCPVDPPRSYVDDFGAPRVGHTHQGNDIFAPVGTPILAPFEGTAEEGFDGLGGIVVHVYASANADYVYNAHLVQHAGVDGQHVVPGQVIGFVGNTGNAAGTPPHDHFEYHPGGGSAVSPYVYLNEVCGAGGQGF